jgi:hypothetical protein
MARQQMEGPGKVSTGVWQRGEPPRRLGGSAAAGAEGSEVLVREHGGQFVADTEIDVAVGENGVNDTNSFVGDGNTQLSAQGNRSLRGSERFGGTKDAGAVRCAETG